MRWGFGWAQGPVRDLAGRRLATDRPGRGRGHRRRPRHERQPLPAWALEPARQGVHAPEGSYSRAAAACALGPAGVPPPDLSRARVRRSARQPWRHRLGKTKACACGTCPTWIRAWPSCRSSPRTTRWAPRCWKASCRRGPRRARVRRAGHLASGSLRRGRQPAAGGRSLRRRPVGHAGSHGREVPARLAGLQVRADPYRRRRAGHGARRRLRVPDACLAPRAGAETSAGRGRRGPDPGRRRQQGIRRPRGPRWPPRPPRPAKSSRSCNRSSRPSPPLRSPRARARPSRPASPASRTSCCSIRTSCCSWPSARPAPPPRPATCRRPGCRTCRSPAAMASPTSEMMLVSMREGGGMISAHDYRGAQRRRGAVRRRDRDRHARGRGMAADRERRSSCAAAAHAGDPGPHPPHLETGKPLRN